MLNHIFDTTNAHLPQRRPFIRGLKANRSSGIRYTPSDIAEDSKAFWLDRGLAPYQAERLANDQVRRGGQFIDPAWVTSRISQLQAVLPVPVAPVLYEDSDLLCPTVGDPEKISQQLVILKELLPGVDLGDIISKQPRLLTMEEAREKIGKVIPKLVKLFPYKSSDKKAEVLKMVQEYPMLLIRMEYYLDDKYRRVEDLPVDVQNNILRNYCG